MTARYDMRNFTMAATGRVVVLLMLVVGLMAPIVATPAEASHGSPRWAPLCPTGAVTWVGGSGNFSNAVNWSSGLVPGAVDNVCVDVSVVVMVDVPVSVNEFVSNGDLVIPAGSSLTTNAASNLASVRLDGSMFVTSGTTWAGFSAIGGGARLDASAGAVLRMGPDRIGPGGPVDLTGGTIDVTGAGDIQLVFGTFLASASTTIASPDGALWLTDSAMLDGATYGIDLTGVMTWYPNGGMSGVVNNYGSMTVTGGQPSEDYVDFGGNFTNYGTILWETRVAWGVPQSLVFVNEGTIDVTNYMNFVGFAGPSSFVNNGTITVADMSGPYSFTGISTSGFAWENNGEISVGELSRIQIADGYWPGTPGDLVNDGTIALGSRHVSGTYVGDSLIVDGDFVNGPSGSLVLGVSGSEASLLYPTVVVGGQASLGGSLVVDRRNNFDPVVGESYPVVSYGSVVGDFGAGSGVDPFFSAAIGATAMSVARIVPDAGSAASATVPAGGVVETDPAVSVTSPLATSVQTPTGGLVSIVEESPVPVSPPAGYAVVGTEFSSVTAPDATAADPLLITFTVDASVWDTFPLLTLSVLRNGVLVPDCTVQGSTGAASPDPCVGSRSGTVGSPAVIVVRTSVASEWVVVHSLNTAPEVTVDAVAPTAIGDTVVIDASITDPDVGDSHVCVVDWGDGTTTSGAVADNTCGASYVYSSAGVFDVTVTVTDAAGASATAGTVVVVFDPSGRVKGEGEFDSPTGAYLPDPALTGEAEFELKARYKTKRGVSQVEGDVEFEIDGFEFESEDLAWLVVTNGSARATGTGTLNDVDGHGFEVWAIDGSPDTFRIRIWSTDPTGTVTVIYDNDPGTPLTDGKITTKTRNHNNHDDGSS